MREVSYHGKENDGAKIWHSQQCQRIPFGNAVDASRDSVMRLNRTGLVLGFSLLLRHLRSVDGFQPDEHCESF